MLVELDVFSGRPNPRWRLDEASARELRQLQAALAPAAGAPPEPPPLGYRGFRYSDAAGGGHAYRGYVRTADVTLSDPSHSIERFLLARLPADHAALRARVEQSFP